MTREIGNVNEGETRHHPVGTAGTDNLHQFRMGGGTDATQARISPHIEGHISIPPLNFGDLSHRGGTTMPAGDARPAATGGQPREHEVKHQDSLWKIAEKSLAGGSDHKASPGQIWHQVQNIVQANKHEHPNLVKNPHLLQDGMKLHIPDPHKPTDRAGNSVGRSVDDTGTAAARHGGERPPAHGQQEAHRPGRAGGDAPPPRSTDKPGAPTDRPPERPRAQDSGDRANDGGAIERALKELGHGLANIARDVAHSLGTIGDCAKGPRLTFKEAGLKLPPAVATEQGRMIRHSGLFDEVPAHQVRPGDYGVRDWNHHVVRAHGGVNKGDSFIVTNVGKKGVIHGANDHNFVVPPDGGRYKNLKFYRPNAEFLRLYGSNM
ncbi:MAG: hypothetical protein JSS83_22345 [Cyanobacteria bacterium SZAS LIN-3]|nr:hypothetical protein [Cyanobacteria bacterium SZAS LIN-3]MBS2009475.1 hypothetical protein [Cyanobacteria bacterium SZAS TMP-1]